jgi:hypothetical protein
MFQGLRVRPPGKSEPEWIFLLFQPGLLDVGVLHYRDSNSGTTSMKLGKIPHGTIFVRFLHLFVGVVPIRRKIAQFSQNYLPGNL